MRDYRDSREGEEGMEGEGGINYQDGPGSAKQVIAVDSPVCHTVNLSLSPGSLLTQAPYLLYTQHNLSA